MAQKMASTFAAVVGRPTWQQTMLRIKDPKKSIPFYTDIMGMTIIDTLDFHQWNFKLRNLLPNSGNEGGAWTTCGASRVRHWN